MRPWQTASAQAVNRSASHAKFIESIGVVRGAGHATLHEDNVHFVHPKTWQRQMGVAKEGGPEYLLEQFPEDVVRDFIWQSRKGNPTRKPNLNISDAWLMALWCLKEHEG